jgi:hypothetical protein
MWLYVSGKDEKIDKWTLGKSYNVEYELGNGKTMTFNNTLENIDDKYYWFLSEESGLDVIKKDRVITMVCEPNRINRVKKIKELHSKVKNKTYIEQRAEEIANKINLNELAEDYYKLGLAHAYGNVMGMIDQDFDKKDMKKFIMDITKDDTQFRSDILGVWGELIKDYL